MKNYNTLEDLHKDFRGVTVQGILNERLHSKTKGWTDIKITDELRVKVVEYVVGLIGGHKATKEAVTLNLFNGKQHWGLGRMILERYDDKPAFLTYSCGQDWNVEMAQMRNFLKK